MLTRDSKLSEYNLILQSKLACVEAINVYSNYKDISTITIGEALDEFLEDGSIDQSWAVWTLKALENEIAEDIRIGFINKIKDPMMAFSVYTKLKVLTKKEDELLKTIFEGKLPKAEKELIDEEITRAKDG